MASSTNFQDDINSLSVDELDRLTQNVLDETTSTRPLLSEITPLSELRAEYERGSETFVKQIDYLQSKGYTQIRRARGDGDCFYRSLAFAWIQGLLASQDQLLDVTKATSLLESSLSILETAGFQALVYEDFYEALVSLIRQIIAPGSDGSTLTPPKLLAAFQNDEVSNSIVVFLRLLTSATIRANDEYVPFLFHPDTANLIAPREFCENFVEACGKEADHVQMNALTKVLNLNVQVAYLDGHGHDGTVSFIEFQHIPPEDALDLPVLLYRPGHYDILEKEKKT